MEETLANLQALDGDQVAAACRTTLSILVQNAMENVENKIFEVLDIIAEKVNKTLAYIFNKIVYKISCI